jgi:hypothetical protein
MPMKRFALPFFVIVLFIQQMVFASNDWGMLIRGGRGFLIAHRDVMKGLPEQHINSAEVFIYKQQQGEEQWKKMYRHPQTGACLFFTPLGNQRVLGQALGAVAYTEFNNYSGKNFSLHFSFGGGLSWFTKTFELPGNIKNPAISSGINAAILFRQSFRYLLNKRNALDAGIAFTHFSNGAFSIPNLGINTTGVFLAYNLLPANYIKPQRPNFDSLLTEPTTKIMMGLNSFFKEVYPVLGPKYFTFSGNLSVMRFNGKRFSWGGGVDVMYNSSIRHHLKNDNNPDNDEDIILQTGLVAIAQIHINRFSFPFQLGYYVFDRYRADGVIYNRIGARYAVNKHLSLNLTLKSHYARADFIEPGILLSW